LVLFKNLECDLQMIVKWLKESGIKVKWGQNRNVFDHRNVQPSTTIKLQRLTIKTKKNVLQVVFDSKLIWSSCVSHAMKIKHIRKKNISLLTKSKFCLQFTSISPFYIILNFGHHLIFALHLKVSCSLHPEEHFKHILTCTTPSSPLHQPCRASTRSK
jgi:hypothetical protein